MVTFGFKAQFEADVSTGRKRSTIRADRKDGRTPAKAGDALQFYVGMRTKACRKIGEGVARRVRRIRIGPRGGVSIAGKAISFAAVRRLARRDGFPSASRLVDFFRATHALPFEGWLIEWRPKPKAKSRRARRVAKRTRR